MAHNPLSFEQLQNLEDFNELSLNARLSSEKVIDVSVSFNSGMGRAIQFTYDVNFNEEISIYVEEAKPAGRLHTGSNYDLDDFEEQSQFSIYLIWLALSPAKRADEHIRGDHGLSRIVEALRFDLQKLTDEQQRRLKGRTQLSQELKSEHLVSICLMLPPNLADGTQIPNLTLPDVLGFKATRVKVEKKSKGFTQREADNFSHLPRIFYAASENDWPKRAEQTHETLFYHFSDSKLISAHDILAHHYSLLVPPDLLPGGKLVFPHALLKNVEVEPEPWKHKFSRSDERPQVGRGYDEIINGILHSTSARLENNELKVVMLERDDNARLAENSRCVNLASISFDAAKLFQWKMNFSEETSLSEMSIELKLEAVEAESKLLAFYRGFLDLDKRVFTSRHLEDEINWFHSIGVNEYDYEHLEENDHSLDFTIRCWPTYEPIFDVEGAQKILDLRSKLRNSKEHFYPFADKQRPQIADAVAEIHVARDGRFSLLRRIENPSAIYVGGFSHFTQRLLESLSADGFRNFFDNDLKTIASNKSKYREFEMKVLKHQGVLNFLIFEALHARFRNSLSDGTPVDSSATIMNLLQAKILILLGVSRFQEKAPLLSELCSEDFFAKLESVVETYFKSDEKFYSIIPQGEVELRSFVEQELRFIFSILEEAALTSRGDIFARARLNLLEKMSAEKNAKFEISLSYSRPVFSDSYKAFYFQPPYSDYRMGLGQTLPLAQSLLPFGFEVFYDNTKLNELSENDFSAEFELSEQAVIPGAANGQTFDWFELNPRFFLGGEEIQQGRATQLIEGGMIEHNGQYYLVPLSRMPSLRRLSNFWERLRKGRGVAKGGGAEATYFQVPRSQILEILALRSEGIQFSGGKKWQEICDFYETLSHPDRELEVSTQFSGELKNYQKIGVQRLYDLYRLGLGAILADDMGLGKTIQVLAFLAKLRDEKRVGNVLIVVPTSLSFNWMSERAKFVPDLDFFEFSPKLKEQMLDFVRDRKPAVVVATYGLLHEHRAFFEQTKWDIAIFDEAQNLKNISAQRTTAARALPAKVKICLTGTPLENHLGEFYSLLDLAVPGCLGERDEFRKVYVNPSTILREDLDFLKLKARPLILRRTKNEILSELPAKQESKVLLTFEKKQKEIYRDIAISYNDKIQQALATEGEAKVQLQMLTALLRLRQACSDPGALPGITYTKTPPKIEALAESLVEIVDSGESALVFTQFLHTLGHIEKVLKEAPEMKDARIFTLQGTMNKKQRENVLREFNETPGGAVLLMTLKTGGVGLNLTKASYVFHIEPWWNPAVENQATDRAHRIGQKRAVQVYRYIMHESVEEKIEALKAQKKLRFDAMFSEAEDAKDISSTGNSLTKEDFNFLLST